MQQRYGNIVNIASIYGMLGPDFSIYEGTTMTMPAEYAAIKGAIISFTRYLATYLAPYNIRVNCLSPGGIFNEQPETFVKKYNKRTPMGRMGNPEDIAGGVLFLLSDLSSYITGQNLVIDGGWSAW
jgi:NAD(P)-dependent dehydrogenase (short-subunit alcohol dehydrogenase family)